MRHRQFVFSVVLAAFIWSDDATAQTNYRISGAWLGNPQTGGGDVDCLGGASPGVIHGAYAAVLYSGANPGEPPILNVYPPQQPGSNDAPPVLASFLLPPGDCKFTGMNFMPGGYPNWGPPPHAQTK